MTRHTRIRSLGMLWLSHTAAAISIMSLPERPGAVLTAAYGAVGALSIIEVTRLSIRDWRLTRGENT